MVRNHNGRILDLVLSNNQITEVVETHPLSKVDKHHPPIKISVKNNLTRDSSMKNNKDNLKPNFYKCNYDIIKTELNNINWPELLDVPDTDTAVSIFYSKINQIISEHVPRKRNDSSNFPIWFSEPLKRCIKEKSRYHKKFKRFGNPRDYDSYDVLRKRSKKMIKECYDLFISSTEQSLEDDNTRSFWRFVSSKRSCSSIPKTMTYGNTCTSDGKEVCELFSDFFISVFNKPSSDNLSSKINISPNDCLSNVTLRKNDLLTKLYHLDSRKGAGPDGISPHFIRSCADALVTPLLILFNKSLSQGVFPKLWKDAYIVPILKSGDSSNCLNYRPISILSCFAKLFESMVYPQMGGFQQVLKNLHFRGLFYLKVFYIRKTLLLKFLLMLVFLLNG